MSKETYRLTVSGIVSYGPEDFELRNLLLGVKKNDGRARLLEALQELEEEASDIKVTLDKP